MGPSPGPARARPGPVHFSRDRARNFEKGPSSTQARDRFFEKGLENWDFYVVKNRGPSRLEIELLWRAWARLKIDIQGFGLARDRPGIDFLGLNPSLVIFSNHISLILQYEFGYVKKKTFKKIKLTTVWAVWYILIVIYEDYIGKKSRNCDMNTDHVLIICHPKYLWR